MEDEMSPLPDAGVGLHVISTQAPALEPPRKARRRASYPSVDTVPPLDTARRCPDHPFGGATLRGPVERALDPRPWRCSRCSALLPCSAERLMRK